MKYDLQQLEYASYGSGNRKILLLHGWGGDLNSLTVIGTPLSRYCELWSLSLPGFGNSPEPGEVWGVQEYMECLVEWTHLNELSGFDIIAHSFGGRVAIKMASNFPGLVRSLVLIDSAGLIPRRSLRTKIRISYARTLSKLVKLIGGSIALKIEKKRQTLGSADWKSATPMMRRVLSRVVNEDQTKDLLRIEAPVKLIWGAEDRDTPVYMAEKMHRMIQNSELEILQGAGHYCFLDKKGDVLTRIWRYFELPAAW